MKFIAMYWEQNTLIPLSFKGLEENNFTDAWNKAQQLGKQPGKPQKEFVVYVNKNRPVTKLIKFFVTTIYTLMQEI
jgi:hypothetical protein